MKNYSAWGSSSIAICQQRKYLARLLDDIKGHMYKHAATCPETDTDNDASYSLAVKMNTSIEGSPEVEIYIAHQTDCDWLKEVEVSR